MPVETQRRMLALYSQGVPRRQLCRDFDVSPERFDYIRKKHGVPGKRNKHDWSPERVGRIVKRYEAGDDISKIASDENLHPTQLYKPLRLGGATLRHANTRMGRKPIVGSTYINDSGYVMERAPDDWPFVKQMYGAGGAGLWIAQHRKNMADHLGRPLTANETVHHINGDKTDNRIENLQLRSGHHGQGQKLCCASCGSIELVPCPLD